MHRLALQRPVSTFLGAATLAVVGIFSLLQLPVSLLPAVERPRVVITARASQSSRDQLLHGLTEPLERRLSAIAGIASMRSETEDGSVRIELETEWQTDSDRLRIEVARRVEGVGTIRPDELNVAVTSSERAPILDIVVGGGGSGASRSAFADKLLVPELARIPGAGRVEVLGSTPRRVVVHPLAAPLAARGLTAEDLWKRLQLVGHALPAGKVREGAIDRPMVVTENVSSLDQLAALRARNTPLGDIARLSIEEVPDRTGFTWAIANNALRSAVLVRVYRAPGANAVALARQVVERINELNATAASGIHLDVISNRSSDVLRAVGELGLSAIAGVLLATIVLRAILGHWKPTLALAVVVPASLLVAFAVFFFAGIPIDVVSLAGLALATGLLVDNSIVVLEAIETARYRGDPDPASSGTDQIVTAVVTSTVTLLIVFVPLLYLRGLARAFFGEQAFSIVASLAASLLFSLTLTPVLARRAAPSSTANPGISIYSRLLKSALRRPALTASVAMLMSLLICGAATLLPRELLPSGEQNALTVRYTLPPDLSRDELQRRATDLERRVQQVGRAHSMSMLASIRGLTDESGLTESVNRGEMTVSFLRSSDAVRALAALRPILASLPELRFDVAPRASTFAEAIGEVDRRMQMIVSGAAVEDADRLSVRAAAAIQRSTGVMPEVADDEKMRTVVDVRWNEPLLAGLGVDRGEVESQVRASLGELDTGRVEIPGVEPSIRLAPTSYDVLRLPIRAASNRVIPLGAIAATTDRARSAAFFRQNGHPARRLFVDLARGGDPERLLRIVEDERRAAGDRVTLAGTALELGRSFRQLRLAFLLAVVLMFLTLAAVYESLLVPLVIMAGVPVAAAGGIIALALTAQSLNLMSFIGLIFLGGIVVNHTVVFIDRIEQLRRSGLDEREAVEDAARERYRPILMTTLTAILGMAPLAVIGGQGVELRRALSIVVVGGLVTSMLASLVVVPILHLLVDRFRRTATIGSGDRGPKQSDAGSGASGTHATTGSQIFSMTKKPPGLVVPGR